MQYRLARNGSCQTTQGKRDSLFRSLMRRVFGKTGWSCNFSSQPAVVHVIFGIEIRLALNGWRRGRNDEASNRPPSHQQLCDIITFASIKRFFVTSSPSTSGIRSADCAAGSRERDEGIVVAASRKHSQCLALSRNPTQLCACGPTEPTMPSRHMARMEEKRRRSVDSGPSTPMGQSQEARITARLAVAQTR
jgi:hypothetical protein